MTVDVHLAAGQERSLADDVHDGLTRPFKELPPKHFYDAHGSELFDLICEQPEYYPTRTELRILRTRGAELMEGVDELVELGSGATTKARILLEAGQAARYIPVDVSETVVRAAADELADLDVDVHGVVGDIERHLDRLPAPSGRRAVAFLGGTIGNFPPGSRRRFLRLIGSLLAPGDRLLLGTDLVKDPAIIEAAYNDAAGVTAEFNRNVLAVVNRELGGDFDLGAFEHVAFFDRRREWVEMRLRALEPQVVTIGALGLEVDFAHREELRTEISAKFTSERIAADLAAAGLTLRKLATDPRGWFAVTVAERA
ncbi:L-histidine N(alpha)-methyltransferase [Capillimicrobium parvum]|uniref:Histidine N-alpha-methyltransferase n=1 Tax=Capillimicrobium parvum TaxID=2884022 RepID=A0A9E7BZV4_9ACTN|nr:L-histidine N(alpha)-methyltransferase [Capillimicrobium parvum]UGS34964.1 Histidine N-alpha-methyltransferase [Capillimicrobium parvum]